MSWHPGITAAVPACQHTSGCGLTHCFSHFFTIAGHTQSALSGTCPPNLTHVMEAAAAAAAAAAEAAPYPREGMSMLQKLLAARPPPPRVDKRKVEQGV